jgi:hypothetical protein
MKMCGKNNALPQDAKESGKRVAVAALKTI